jgi:aspartyl protease family protein
VPPQSHHNLKFTIQLPNVDRSNDYPQAKYSTMPKHYQHLLITVRATSLATSLMLLPFEALLPLPQTHSQAQGICYMEDSGGNVIDLGSLCQRSQPGRASQTNSRVVRVPIKRRDGGIPIIDVTFNGNHTYEMLLDTGASLTLITRSMANDMQIGANGERPRFETFSIADGSAVQMQIIQLESVGVSNAVVDDVTVAVADRMIIGLLGQNFFGGYDIRIMEESIEFHQRS